MIDISLLPRALFKWALLQQHKKTEAYEQICFVQWLEEQGLTHTAIPASTFTKSIRPKLINKATGLKKGFPDLVVVIPKERTTYTQ